MSKPLFVFRRSYMTTNGLKPKTGIVMMNMGGPGNPSDTRDFLYNLFNDPDIIPMGGGKKQDLLARLIVSRRTPKIEEQYRQIGGSPITQWTQLQGNEMCKILDEISPETGPHKHYIMFRYVPPMTQDTLIEMKNDGINHAIAFSQYPQWCCNTTGSSMNELNRQLKSMNMEDTFKWSIIDRWYNNDGYINALVDNIERSLIERLNENQRQNCVILFSAHSLPIKSVDKGIYCYEYILYIRSMEYIDI